MTYASNDSFWVSGEQKTRVTPICYKIHSNISGISTRANAMFSFVKLDPQPTSRYFDFNEKVTIIINKI